MKLHEDPESFSSRLRAVAAEVDPNAILRDVQSLDGIFSFNAFVLGWVALGAKVMIGILFALSVSGIYALMSFTVTERTREIGIRAALGSKRSGLVTTIARRAVALSIGILIGGTISLSLLWRIESEGLLSYEAPILGAFMTSLGLTLLIGVVACTAPTLRALRIKPAETFRSGG
jgi:putative ABC transport system permease protein